MVDAAHWRAISYAVALLTSPPEAGKGIEGGYPAVGEQDDHSRDEAVEPDLRDVLAVAILMTSYAADVPGLEMALNGLPSTIRLGLDEARIRVVMEQSAAEVAALSDALRA